MAALVHKDDYYETPAKLVNFISGYIRHSFTVDLCASETNAKAPKFFTEEYDVLDPKHGDLDLSGEVVFCNPPRSKNAKFITKCFDIWKSGNVTLVVLMCWQDFGYKYAEPVFELIEDGLFSAHNLGKVRFEKNGLPTKHQSRNTYLWVYMPPKAI